MVDPLFIAEANEGYTKSSELGHIITEILNDYMVKSRIAFESKNIITRHFSEKSGNMKSCIIDDFCI